MVHAAGVVGVTGKGCRRRAAVRTRHVRAVARVDDRRHCRVQPAHARHRRRGRESRPAVGVRPGLKCHHRGRRGLVHRHCPGRVGEGVVCRYSVRATGRLRAACIARRCVGRHARRLGRQYSGVFSVNEPGNVRREGRHWIAVGHGRTWSRHCQLHRRDACRRGRLRQGVIGSRRPPGERQAGDLHRLTVPDVAVRSKRTHGRTAEGHAVRVHYAHQHLVRGVEGGVSQAVIRPATRRDAGDGQRLLIHRVDGRPRTGAREVRIAGVHSLYLGSSRRQVRGRGLCVAGVVQGRCGTDIDPVDPAVGAVFELHRPGRRSGAVGRAVSHRRRQRHRVAISWSRRRGDFQGGLRAGHVHRVIDGRRPARIVAVTGIVGRRDGVGRHACWQLRRRHRRRARVV